MLRILFLTISVIFLQCADPGYFQEEDGADRGSDQRDEGPDSAQAALLQAKQDEPGDLGL